MRLRSCVVALLLSALCPACSEEIPDEDLSNGAGGGIAGGGGGTVIDTPDTGGASDATADAVSDATDAARDVPTDVAVNRERLARITQQLEGAASGCTLYCQSIAACQSAFVATCGTSCPAIPDTVGARLSDSLDSVRCAESLNTAFRCVSAFDCEEYFDAQQGFDNDCTSSIALAVDRCDPFRISTRNVLGLF
jgi:hypothetical protein